MKKLLSLILCIIFCFALFSCSFEGDIQSTGNTTDTRKAKSTTLPSNPIPTAPPQENDQQSSPTHPHAEKYTLYAYKSCDCAINFSSGFKAPTYVEPSEYDVFMPQEISFTLAGKEYHCELQSTAPRRTLNNNFLLHTYYDEYRNLFEFGADGKMHSAALQRVDHEENEPTLTLEQIQEIATSAVQGILNEDISAYKMTHSLSDSVTPKHSFTFKKYIGEIETSEYVSISLSEYGDVESIRSSMLNKIPADKDYSFINMEEISEIIEYVSMLWKNTSSNKNREVTVNSTLFSLIKNDIPCFIVDFKLGGDPVDMFDNGHLMRLVICYERSE